ncbi:hypothetical protein HK405_000155, partial [Cladochytrium tenue]
LCFCRVVFARGGPLVMVRVGGGWQELGHFLRDHSILEARLPTIRSFAPADPDDAEGGGAGSSTDASSSVPTPSPEAGQSYIVIDSEEVGNPYNLALHRAMGTWAPRKG